MELSLVSLCVRASSFHPAVDLQEKQKDFLKKLTHETKKLKEKIQLEPQRVQAWLPNHTTPTKRL